MHSKRPAYPTVNINLNTFNIYANAFTIKEKYQYQNFILF